MGSFEQQTLCLVGAYCAHAILTKKVGIYRCPFGVCLKKLENQKTKFIVDSSGACGVHQLAGHGSVTKATCGERCSGKKLEGQR